MTTKTAMPELDVTDRKILALLQDDADITNKGLAEKVCLSAPPTLRRVLRLKEEGVIRGVHADIDPKAAGWPITFFVHLDMGNQVGVNHLAETVSRWDETRECHTTGTDTVILKMIARDLEHELALLDRFAQIAGIRSIRHVRVLSTQVSRHGVPIFDSNLPKET
jgi:DNA-binding Lrp family transcriptional regulator